MKIKFNFYQDPAGDPGGEGGGGAGGGASNPNPDPNPAPADPNPNPAPADPNPNPPPAPADPKSAFASSFDPKGGDPAPKTDDAPDQDLLKMSDDDWAKAVLPDGEDGQAPDRSIVTAIAQVSRENGVTPQAMQKVMARFNEVCAQREAERAAAAQKDADELSKAAVAAFDESGWKDIHAASARFVKPGGMLDKALRETVLGSDVEFLTILKNLGSSLRGDAPPGTATTGSGSSPDHRLFMRTVPANLR